jgi:hypothetical protein
MENHARNIFVFFCLAFFHRTVHHRKGDVLSSEQARILKLLGQEQAEFRLRMVAVWANDGTFTPLAALEASGDDTEEPDMSDDD